MAPVPAMPSPGLVPMERSQIDRVSVADQVAAILRHRILTGELRPGTPLQEVPLAASLGVSRNTMREATRILSLENLLKRSIHRGVAVALIPVRRKMYHLLAAGKCKECAAVLVQHLDDSESRLSRIMTGEIPKKKRNRKSEKA